MRDGVIGVFDSGIGGLTVLQALKKHYPQESYVYIGDTARLPYGTKSRDTIIAYTESIVRVLLQHPLKALVIACNTASTHALDSVCAMAPHLPVIGMIQPASQAAVAATKNDHIAVIGTVGTVRSKAYDTAIHALAPAVQVTSQACQMLVALAEEGWRDGYIADAILQQYLDPLLRPADKECPDTLILGCTHFPVFEDAIRGLYGHDLTLINSGVSAASTLKDRFCNVPAASVIDPLLKFYVTDGPERFAGQAQLFFDHVVRPEDVHLFDLCHPASFVL